jgi:hypothetical protein
MYFFKTVINVFVGTSVVSITVARYRFLVTTPDNRGLDVDSMDSQALFSQKEIVEALEHMFVVFIGSKIVVTNFEVHERKDD